MKAYLLLPLISLIYGCATIKYKTTLHQETEVELIAGIGDVVYSSKTVKDLPNAFGKADLFGRTTPTGQTNVVFEGFKGTSAIFRRRSIDIETGATTMNSTPIIINNATTTTHSGTIGSTPYSGSSTTTGPSTVIMPSTPKATYIDRANVVIKVDTNLLPKCFIIEGIKIQILAATDNHVRYVLHK